MALTVAEQILERCEKGEKVTTKERRHALAYLMVTAVKSNYELAEVFHVSERQIRFDKTAIRNEKKEQLRVDDIALIVVDLQMNIERQIRDLELSKAKCKLGTDAYTKHCTSIAKIQMELNKSLQDLGWLPKNMGNMSISHYNYEAIIRQDGSAESGRVGELPPVMEAEFTSMEPVPMLTEGQNGGTETRKED